MKFKKNERIRIVDSHADAGRFGVHLKTIRYQGKLIHIVFLDGDTSPALIDQGRLERVQLTDCADK